MSGPPIWPEMTALFGGRFDPPHRGHRAAVLGLFKEPGIQRVLVLPSASPAHKPCIASAQDRLAMAHLNFAGIPNTELNPCEIDRARRDAKATYTYDTLQELGRQIPNLAFVIGTDQLRDLPNWYRFPEVLSLSHWIVLERKGAPYSAASSGLLDPLLHRKAERLWRIGHTNHYLVIVHTEAPDLSSTQIRREISLKGQPEPHSLLPEVLDYLKLHHIYGTETSNDL